MPPQSASDLTRPQFASSFMDRHAGTIIRDPYVAVVEIVANCWDAGATRVEITWPSDTEGQIRFKDNGVGMTEQEFLHRWMTLNYDRITEQGEFVDSPKVKSDKRRAFGRNGIGRHAPFCFSDAYTVKTCRRKNDAIAYRVERSDGEAPFSLARLEDSDAHEGTAIYMVTEDRHLSTGEVKSLLGTRFVASPEFEIVLNGETIELADLSAFSHEYEVVTRSHTYLVRRFEYERASRTADLHGVAFWTNGRLVGNPDWRVGTTTLLDARTATAKQTTYVVIADNLVADTKPDWSGYYASAEVVELEKAVISAVKADLHLLTGEERKRKKTDALRENKARISRLPVVSQEKVARFAERLLEDAPSLTANDLDHAVHVLANLEDASSGFSLVHQLARLDPDDLDALDRLLKEWTVHDLAIVADELRYRLELVEHLEGLLNAEAVDEVHELLPLFERGLWVFGPEFEAIEFMSNRALTTIVRGLLDTESSSDARRPDLVAAEVFACEAFDEDHEVNGFETVLIVELKRIPHTIVPEDKDQAMSYARKVKQAPSVGEGPRIICWVLGSALGNDATDTTFEGKTEIKPTTYAKLLGRAHARTFHLLRRLESELNLDRDTELASVLEEGIEESLIAPE